MQCHRAHGVVGLSRSLGMYATAGRDRRVRERKQPWEWFELTPEIEVSGSISDVSIDLFFEMGLQSNIFSCIATTVQWTEIYPDFDTEVIPTAPEHPSQLLRSAQFLVSKGSWESYQPPHRAQTSIIDPRITIGRISMMH